MAAQTNKPLIAAGVALIILGGGWMYAKHQATVIAKDRIDGFLIRNNLTAQVSYQDLSASPFGSATLSGVKLASPSGSAVSIGSLEISDVEMKGDQLRAVRISAEKAEVPLLAMARQQRNPDKVLREAIGLGYTSLTGSVDALLRYDEQKAAIDFETSGEIRDLGTWTAKLRVANLDAATINTLYALSNNAAQLGGLALLSVMGQAGEALTRLSLAEADVAIDNSGLFKRANEITDHDMPSEGAAEVSSAFDERELVRAGIAPSEAAITRNTVENWLRKGGSLRVASNLGQPLPLFRGGNIFAPSFDSLPGFLVATKSRISN